MNAKKFQNGVMRQTMEDFYTQGGGMVGFPPKALDRIAELYEDGVTVIAASKTLMKEGVLSLS